MPPQSTLSSEVLKSLNDEKDAQLEQVIAKCAVGVACPDRDCYLLPDCCVTATQGESRRGVGAGCTGAAAGGGHKDVEGGSPNGPHRLAPHTHHTFAQSQFNHTQLLNLELQRISESYESRKDSIQKVSVHTRLHRVLC